MAEAVLTTYPEIPSLVETDLSDPDAVNQAALRMEELLLGQPANPTEDVGQTLGQEILTATSLLYERFETNLEFDFANRLLNGEAGVEDYPLYERFRRLISNEVSLAAIRPDTKVLFIGSGPFPISPILIHQLSGGAQVECFDSSDKACRVSQKVIQKIGLEDSIKVKNTVGERTATPTISTQGDIHHAVIVVALLAQPKDRIVSNIVLSTGPYSVIVMRTSEGNRRVLYQGVDSAAVVSSSFTKSPGFDILGSYHAGVDDTISGVVMSPRYVPWVYRI